MDPAGSIWLPFVTNATSFLKGGGRLAFVLPFDLTYVRYAKPLWRSLGREFGSLRVVRVHERLFPEPLQDVVILLANERGATASAVQYECFERRAELLDGSPTISSNLDLDRIIGDERPFMEALLPGDLQGLLQGRLSRRVPGGVRAASRIDRDDDSLLAKLSPAGPGPGSSSSPPDVLPENVRRAARAPGARAYPEPRHAHARSCPGAVAARTHEGLIARPVMLAGAIWRTRWARALAVDGNPPPQPDPATAEAIA